MSEVQATEGQDIGDGDCCRDREAGTPEEGERKEEGIPTKEMGPVGDWATGRPELSGGPGGELTGTRPVVDHYSITRYSEPEWRKHNEEVLSCTADQIRRVDLAEYSSKRGMSCGAELADRAQEQSKKRLLGAAAQLQQWRAEVARSIQALAAEIRALEAERRRTCQARSVLAIARSINSECLNRRGFRDGYDLARDNVEEELIKEAALIEEVGGLIARALRQLDEQQARNRSMKERLECDWSDKTEALQLTTESASLKTDSPTIMFKPASARFPEQQSTEAGWERNCREVVKAAEGTAGQSAELRALLQGPILRDAMRDLKNQAEEVDMALGRNVLRLEQIIVAMKRELETVVRRNAESDTLIFELQQGIRGLDKAMKVAQTRLDNALLRPGVENCRDKAQFSLIEEVKMLGESSTTLKGQLVEAETALLELIKSRATLEKELQVKLKTLDIDRNRCQACRLHYPSAVALSGF